MHLAQIGVACLCPRVMSLVHYVTKCFFFFNTWLCPSTTDSAHETETILDGTPLQTTWQETMVALSGTSLQIERGADRPTDRPTDRQCHEKKRRKDGCSEKDILSFIPRPCRAPALDYLTRPENKARTSLQTDSVTRDWDTSTCSGDRSLDHICYFLSLHGHFP